MRLLRFLSRPLNRILTGALAGMLLAWGCRIPEVPVFHDKSQGILYDTAMEADLRSGKSPALLQSAYAAYVDTLAEPVAVTKWSDEASEWEVFVGTNRGVWDDDADANRVLTAPQFGRAAVTLPRQAKPPRSAIALPWQKEPAEPVEPVVVSAPVSTETFLSGVRAQLERSRQRDLLLFVHGFNVSFDQALISSANLALKMPFNGAVTAYCWPTQGGVSNYSTDEPINKQSVEPFSAFLQTLREGVPAETRITILVHSMGNRIVMEALDAMPAPRGPKPFAQVLLCAPDVGRSDFERWAPGVIAQSERVSLYSNASDTALIASKGLHSEARAGDAWRPLLVEGIEVVDCSRVDLTFMGHSYYGENRDVLSDLFMLVKEHRPASDRPHLERRESSTGAVYWSFQRTAPAILCTWHFDDLPQ